MTKPLDRRKNETPLRVACIVVAAGKGTRAGGHIPKQFQMLAGHPLLFHSMRALASHGQISEIVTIIPAGEDARFNEVAKPLTHDFGESFRAVIGGDTRQASVYNGLEALSASPPDLVLIHDGARPFPSPELIDRVIQALIAGQKAVIPGAAVTDTVKIVDLASDTVGETLDRDSLRRVQTPQGFRYKDILAAHRAALGAVTGGSYTDDAAVAEAAGMAVTVVDGDERNIKITHEGDIQREEALIAFGKLPRVGTGFDVHRFEPGDGVWLCGVFIPHSAKLRGHSDADVGLHALTDAVLGAAALGDIGDHFPPSDPQWAGADSARFLAHACALLREKGGQLTHLDVTLICEKPKLCAYKQTMRNRIAEIAEIPCEAVSVKATTTEKLGFTGREEGIAAQAVATVLL